MGAQFTEDLISSSRLVSTSNSWNVMAGVI